MKNNNTSQLFLDKPIQPTLKKMKMYDRELFRIEKLNIVRTTASIVSVTNNMKFKTKQNKSEKVIEVTRIG